MSSPSVASDLEAAFFSDQRLNAALWANRLIFFLFGTVFAFWATHLPILQSFYALSNSGVSTVLFLLTAGALLGLTQVSRLLHHVGMLTAIKVLGISSVLVLPLLFVTPSVPLLWTGIFIFGICSGAIDVCINVEATTIEKHLKRPVLSGIHGMFSLGGLVGAACSSLLIKWQVPSLIIFFAIAACSIALVWSVLRFLLPPSTEPKDSADKRFIWPRGLLAILALVTTLGMMIEGAVYDWSALLMVQEFASDPAFAAWSYAAFSGAMALGRFTGDFLRARVSDFQLLKTTCLLATCALAIGLWVQNEWLILIVFALLGLAIANWVPVFYASATQLSGTRSSAQAISSLTSVGYLGFLIGPIVVGYVADLWGLLYAFAGIVAACAVMGVVAPAALKKVPSPKSTA